MAVPRTLYDLIRDDHVVETFLTGTCLLAVDRQMIYEGTSFQAFEALHATGRSVRRPSATIAVPDHLVPTHDRSPGASRSGSRKMVEAPWALLRRQSARRVHRTCRAAGRPERPKAHWSRILDRGARGDIVTRLR